MSRFIVRAASFSLKSGIQNSIPRLTIPSLLSRPVRFAFVSSHRSFSSKPSIFASMPLLLKNRLLSTASLNTESAFNASEQPEIASTAPLSSASVGYWYIFTATLVFGIVIIGGLTRLTESGLSITEWNLVSGMRFPSSAAEWAVEFDKYKATPEFALMNSTISLSDFQFIFFMEWAHRMWGRMIGVCFIVPGVVFALRGKMTPAIQKRSLFVAALIGMQVITPVSLSSKGLLGWYMVSSGLDAQHIADRPVSVPRVSQYRLAAHLGSAFLIYSIMLATGLEIIKANRLRVSPAIKELLTSNLSTFKSVAKGITALIFITAISGAFVAGLDAGLIYNEFPKMGDSYIPSDMWALSNGVNGISPIPWFLNLLENPSAVQFNHRVLGVSTATAVTALWIYSRKLVLPPQARIAMNFLMLVAGMQVTLGITTLIYFVPVPLAAAHQSGSLTLLSVGIWLLHTLRKVPKRVRVL